MINATVIIFVVAVYLKCSSSSTSSSSSSSSSSSGGGGCSTVMRYLMTGIRSEKCISRQFCHFVNVTDCTYTNLNSIAYCTPRLYGIAYCS